MSRPRFLAGVSLLAGVAVVVSGVAFAQDVIAKRQEIMKGIGKATKQSVQMVKGEIPYDAAKAKANMDAFAAWSGSASLFPKGSETGGDTTASPKIWQSFEEFDAKGKKLVADAGKAGAAAANGLDAFKAAFGDVTKNCKGCHETYRIKK